MNKFHVQNITSSNEDSNDCVWSKSHWLNENLAGGHHSLLTPISLQLTKPPTTSMVVVQYDYTRYEDFGVIVVKYFRKTFPPFQCDSHGLPMGIQNGGERRGTSPTKAFLCRSETSEHTCKTQHICKKIGTYLKSKQTHFQKKSEHICKKNRNIFAKNKNTFAKKLGTHLQKNASYLLFSLNPWKDAKLWQSWNEGGWIVRDHLQDTFGSFPKWQMIIMLVGAEEIIPGWGKEWENSEKVRCCTVPSLPVQTPVPPKHWQYLSMLFTQGIHSIPHSP